MAHHIKEHKIFQPPGILAFEVRKTAQVRSVSLQEVLCRLLQKRELERFYCFKVNSAMRTGLIFGFIFFDAVAGQPAAFDQHFQTDQQRVAGKSGNG